jgi:hypothetical protein
MKRCSRCKQDKPLQEFHRDASRVDGRQNYCAACRREYTTVNRKRIRKTKRDHARRAYAAGKLKPADPRMRAAQAKVNHEMRMGRMTAEPCLFCDRQDSHAHHHDYDAPLSVTFLCPPHHALAHGKKVAVGVAVADDVGEARSLRECRADRNARIVRMRSEGHTQEAIAAAVGCHQATVSNVLKAA